MSNFLMPKFKIKIENSDDDFEDDSEEEDGGGEDEDEEDGTAPMAAVPSHLATLVSAPPQ